MPLYERRRVIRAFPYLLVAGLILYLGLIAGPMWLTRWRFRHLLADFNSVRATESTWADAQGLMRHWGRFGHYDGSCTAASCQYVIIVEDPLSVGIGKAGEETIDRLNRLHVFSLAERLGWRSARLYFSFTVRNGMILRTSSGFLLQVPAFANGQWDWPLSLGLATEIRDRLHRGDPVLHRHERPALGNDEQLADHPDWKVGRPDGCKPNCEEARIAYTPSLARSELVRLTSYDFSCLTRLHPCKELGDMLRAARDWHLYDPEYEVTNTTPMPPCDTDPRALGRDAEIVLEVQSLSVRKE